MAPRFMQRMQRQSDTLKQVFGSEPVHDPPPYAYSTHSRTTSVSSSRPDNASVASATTAPPSYQRSAQINQIGETTCIPRDSTVLVTGANGWLASHVIDKLLSLGYCVRGTVRDDDKAVWTTQTFCDKYGPDRYTACIVPEMSEPGAYNLAIKGCSGIIHIASVTTFSTHAHDVIPPTIMGALNALEAAAKEPKVRCFVYCSSVTAAASRGGGLRKEVTSESWNMGVFKAAWDRLPTENLDRAWSVFASSKMQAEQAVWKWYREKRPNFVLNCVLPDMLFGRPLTPHQPSLGLSTHILRAVYESRSRAIEWVPPQHFADVQDAALVHVAALILPGVMSERLFVAAVPYNINSLVQLLRGLYPERGINGWVEDHGVDQTTYVESGRAEELLRRMGKKGWTDMETSVSAACESWK
ncbi:hypothetical protein AMS68_002447 [Peltaster fructicola]|uniref:NAD-dependent epimerase/dehydratase domain-containing protein n=1 Tax=Peltaster fructicola TaxID=286661 RepID=A0A6H0XR38_9PEZI|nr:hypothetical protein AMS68_002447 [Peltaster fructicola]